MIRTSALAAFAALAVATSAFAADLGGFAETASTYDFPQGVPPRLTVQPVGPVAVGGLPVLLEQTPLSDVTAKFGGAIQTGEDATGTAYAFACYDLKSRTLWFRADGGGGDAAVTMVAIQNGGAETGWECADAPDSLDTVSFGVPGLGAPTEEVSARLGASTPDTDGRLGYLSEVPSDADPGAFVRQTILYRISDGTVSAMAVTQKTSG